MVFFINKTFIFVSGIAVIFRNYRYKI